eukprot:TRINITY_DN38415_c0_g1_i1.p1 TRINITY_DN38415_c0_g1~~TRINITY_DN38415_c0_g1_i1.p1  ORF type:complete len:275 (-),score=57.23 TRINITY_DN38415_c0_g1_i1:55-879(-)
MQALPGSAAARGEATPLQRTVLATLLGLGSLDLFGPDALGLHSMPAFGALRSMHWLQGLLQAQALECQLQLLALLKNREVVLRLLGATRVMGLTICLFLGGLTASVGFLVSRSEFTAFVDSFAPPPRAAAVIVALRRQRGRYALILGAGAGLLWQLPSGHGIAATVGSGGLAAVSAWLYRSTFEEHRNTLLEPSGGRWLLVLPETSERAKLEALQVWNKLKHDAAKVAVERGASYVGRSVMEGGLSYVGSLWSSRGVASVAVEALETTAEAKAH